jgi:hypothetical protein
LSARIRELGTTKSITTKHNIRRENEKGPRHHHHHRTDGGTEGGFPFLPDAGMDREPLSFIA